MVRAMVVVLLLAAVPAFGADMYSKVDTYDANNNIITVIVDGVDFGVSQPLVAWGLQINDENGNIRTDIDPWNTLTFYVRDDGLWAVGNSYQSTSYVALSGGAYSGTYSGDGITLTVEGGRVTYTQIVPNTVPLVNIGAGSLMIGGGSGSYVGTVTDLGGSGTLAGGYALGGWYGGITPMVGTPPGIGGGGGAQGGSSPIDALITAVDLSGMAGMIAVILGFAVMIMISFIAFKLVKKSLGLAGSK